MAHDYENLIISTTDKHMEQKNLSSGQKRGKSKRSSSTENQSLRDTITSLELQLLKSKQETNQSNDKLNCLINLVKRSWMADTQASLQVAKIVGVAPPSLEVGLYSNELVVIPKSAVLNNWARLTIGLLNRVNLYHEREQKVEQLTYLFKRERYLDECLGNFVQDPLLKDSDVTDIISSGLLKSVKEKYDSEQQTMKQQQELHQQQKEKLAGKHMQQKLISSRQNLQCRLKNDEHTFEQQIGENMNGLDFRIISCNPKPTECSSKTVEEIILEDLETTKSSDKAIEQEEQDILNPSTYLESKESVFDSENDDGKISQAIQLKTPKPKTPRYPPRAQIKVQISKKTSRPSSAYEQTVQKMSIMSLHRKRSLEASTSYRNNSYHLERIERDIKKHTRALQKKLNIDPKGFLRLDNR